MGVGMSLLGGVAIGTPDLWPVPVHQGPDHDAAAGWSGTMDDSVVAAERHLPSA
jgi:hypothetical protein